MDVYKTLRDRREAIDARLKEITEASQAETRAFSAEENTEIDTLVAERGQNVAREEELREQELGEIRADRARLEIVGAAGVAQTSVAEPNPVYRRGDASTSFFADLAVSQKSNLPGFSDARERLARSQETRAGDLTTVAGAGGEFAPPLWLVEDFVELARPGRVTADVVQNDVLPSGISSINLPKVVTGTTTATQTTQNTAVSDTALTTGAVSGSVNTIAGKQIISMQLLQQSGIPFDRVVLSDLSRAYAVSLDAQVISAISGLSGANAIAVTATTATGAASTYSGVANGIQQVQTKRYLPPTAIVMHPRRWMWLVSSVDSQGRPLVVPDGTGFNQLVNRENGSAQGRVGTMLGLPVYVDPSVPTNKGAGTNQDEIYVLVADDLWLYESALSAASFDATYADQMSVLFRVSGYNIFIPNRYPASVSVLGGAGLVPPTF